MDAGRIMRYTKSSALVNKRFRAFFVPALLAAMATQMGVFFDGIIMGQLINSAAMASASACQPLTQFASALTVLISTGSVGLIAVAAGNGKRDEANRAFSIAFYVTIGIGLAISAVLLPAARGVVRLLTPVPELWESVYAYLHILAWRFPICMLLMLMADLVCADGMEKLSTAAVSIQQLSNILLDYVLIRFLGLGIEGAAMATVFSDIAGLGFMLWRYFALKKRTFRLVSVMSSGLKAVFRGIGRIVKSGVATASGFALVAVRVWFLMRITGEVGGSEGTEVLAACLLFLTLLSMFSGGINQSVLPLVGVLFGEKDYRSIRMLMRYVSRILLAIVGISVLFAMIFPHVILAVAGLAQDLAARSVNDVRLYSVSLIGTAITFLVIYYYTTVSQTKAAGILAWTEGLLAVIPGVWLFSRAFGLTGVWLGLIFAEIAGLTVTWLYAKRVCAKSGGKLTDFYLIEKNGSELLYDVSIKTTREDAAGISADVIGILTEKGVDPVPAEKAGIVLEETAVNLARMNRKPVDMDVRVLENGNELVLALCDNGIPFNPVEYVSPERDDPDSRGDGIMVLRSVAGRIDYSLVLALNQTTITFMMPDKQNLEG